MDNWMCNLCGMTFPEDTDFLARKHVHERWHRGCRKEKRNTTEGEVDWIYQPEPKEEPEHEHQTTVDWDECSRCGCLSIAYEHCNECGYYEGVQECSCLEDDDGGDDDW